MRIPSSLLAYLDEMAEHADLSRNAMGTLLLQWGIDHALEQLPEDMSDAIRLAVDGPDFIHSKEL